MRRAGGRLYRGARRGVRRVYHGLRRRLRRRTLEHVLARARARREYRTGPLRHEPDTFVLYRIIGNDLPPRHRFGQSLANLRFILDHEPDLPGCQKRWVVNRIVDPAVEKAVISLLEERGVRYLHIPFEVEAYRGIGWRFGDFDLPGLTYRREFHELLPSRQQWALDQVYHDKNLYVMNNNGARNAALRQGRALAKWVLPWDGNCFLTADAWARLVARVTARPHLKYFTVPMARVLDNQILLGPDPDVKPSEEPQLVFRRDSREEFDERARYGRCPKVELFWRLEIEGPWERWCLGPWDAARAPLSPEAGQFGRAGWVARLSSGEQALERHYRDRATRRSEAIRARIDQVDESLAAEVFDPLAMLTIDAEVLDRQREAWRSGDPRTRELVDQLTSRVGDEDISVLALAGYLTGETGWLRRAADLVHTGLPVTGSHYRLDAVRLLEREQVLPAGSLKGRLPRPADHRSALDHRGTWYDVQRAAVHAYAGNLRGLLATLRRAQERIWQQFDADGAQPAERSIEDALHNLHGWLLLVWAGRRVGQDLWSYRTSDGRGLAPALRWLLAQPADPDRLAVLAHLAGAGDGDPYRLPQLFDPRFGIRPFWALGARR